MRSLIAARHIDKRQFPISQVATCSAFGRQDFEAQNSWNVVDFGGHPGCFHNLVVLTNAAAKPTSDAAGEKQRNKQLVSRGKAQDWKGIVDLYWNEKDSFSIINVPTMFDQLRNIKGRDNDNKEQLVAVFKALDTWVKEQGVNSWYSR